MVGALAWTALCAYAGAGKAPLGVIELLVLFAVLVIVPLGMALGDIVAPIRSHRIKLALEMLQPFAAAMVMASFWMTPGRPAAVIAALPCAVLFFAIGLTGTLALREVRSLFTFAANFGRIDLAVAGAWLLASRSGLRPLGMQEPIILLTAVHFSYTGFASAMILAAAMKACVKRGVTQSLRWISVLMLFVPFLVATGFVYSPFLKMFAGVLLAVSMIGLSVVQLVIAGSGNSRAGRAYLYVSSCAVAAGMGIATVYAIGDWLHRDWLPIPQVAQTHGILNALGFALCGLLGWLIEFSVPSSISLVEALAHEHSLVSMK
jgi:hypothetical protein